MNESLLEEFRRFKSEGYANEEAFELCLDDIENRLSDLEDVAHTDIPHPVQSKADNSTATVEALDKAKVMIAKYNSDDRLAEIIDQVKQELQPVPEAVDGGWMTLKALVVWAYWTTGEITKEYLEDIIYEKGKFGNPRHPTHIRPYILGESKPESPKSEVK